MNNIPRIPEDDLLDDLDSGYKVNREKSRKKKILIFGGVAAGLAMAFFSYYQPVQEATKTKPTPVSKPAPKPEPEVEPAPGQAGEQAEALVPSEEGQDPAQVEARLAALNKKNLIQEDISSSSTEEPPLIIKKADTARLRVEKDSKPETVSVKEPPIKAIVIEKKSAKATPKTVAKPKNEKTVEPKKAPRPVKQDLPEDGRYFTVQVIATNDALAALEIRDKLTARGHKPWVVTESARREVYRVEVGSFNSIREAAGLSMKLAEAGFQNRAAYLSGGKRVTLLVGSFISKKDADVLAKKAQKAGFKTKINLTSDSSNKYMVRVGKFKTKKEARDTMVKVRKAGFHPEGIIQ